MLSALASASRFASTKLKSVQVVDNLRYNRIMDKLIATVTKVVNAFDNAKISFESSDDGAGSLDYIPIGNHEIIVCDDDEREDWCVTLNFDGKDPNVLNAITSALGEPSKRHDNGALNWGSFNQVLVVFSGDSMEFIQRYSKR